VTGLIMLMNVKKSLNTPRGTTAVIGLIVLIYMKSR
jgi:hypothetical protein